MKKLLHNLLKLQELEFADVHDSSAEAAISRLRQKIPSPILKHYDRLTDQGKRGVAMVRHKVCTGCHMTIPIGAIVTLMQNEEIQRCENCGRYLYLPSEAPHKLLQDPGEAKTAARPGRPSHRQLMRAT